MIEDRVVGLKSREVYECPGSITLIAAHIALERLVLTREELRSKPGSISATPS
jgi:argininosuccinate synthase